MKDLNLAKTLRSQIARYRIASIDLLLKELPEDQRNPAMRILESGNAFQVVDGLTAGRGVYQRRRKPPAKCTVARCFAIHHFCRATTVKRYFPDLFRNGLPAGYYVDTNGEEPVLGLLRVDVHLTSVRRIWERSLRLIEKHRTQSAFRELITTFPDVAGL